MLDLIVGGLAVYIICRMEQLANKVEKQVLGRPGDKGDQDAGWSRVGSGGLLPDPSEAGGVQPVRRGTDETTRDAALRDSLRAIVDANA